MTPTLERRKSSGAISLLSNDSIASSYREKKRKKIYLEDRMVPFDFLT